MKKNNQTNCCQIEAIVTMDDRGQFVIPKDVRSKFDMKTGDKYALVSCQESEDGTGLCCFTLMKTDHMKGVVQKVLGPMFNDIVNG